MVESSAKEPQRIPGPLLPQGFYDRPAVEVAPELLGAVLVHDGPEGCTCGRIVEVEAYAGPEDRAAHSWGGRRTARTEVMYGPPGRTYVFAIYGMHWCFNVVAGPGGKPEAILVRALEPLCGLELMRRRRSRPARLRGPQPEVGAAPARLNETFHCHSSPAAERLVESRRPERASRLLTAGPARLCQALGITGEAYGLPLWEPSSPLRIHRGEAPLPPGRIATGPRVGVDYAGAWRERPWRFWIRDNPFVSA
ncbi:MAG: DNA-3-methyladenine glycosylase [Bacillota bacterium]|nr:DNA-3-methyladenine glycosylase [Bacillota bacterium]